MSGRSRQEAIVTAIPRAIAGAAIFVSIGINFANIIGRYVFMSPVVWAEEILIYLMVWSVFIGAILVTLEGRHIKMDLLSVMMPSPIKEIVNFVAAITFVGVCGFVAVQSWTATTVIAGYDQRGMASNIPMGIPHAAVLLGFIGMLLAVLFRFRSYVTNAFGSETEAAAKQVVETFGVFEGAEGPEQPARKSAP